MVQALIEINENTNRVLNIIKAKFDFKDKSETIEYLVSEYIDKSNEPELRPEFIEKIKKIHKEKSIKVKSFAEKYGVK